MKAYQKFCYSKNFDSVGFVETACRLWYKVHFARLLHSVSFYWISFEESMVFA